MVRGRKERATGKKVSREPAGDEREREFPGRSGGACDGFREDEGQDDYIWPDCSPEDEDAL